MSPKLLLVCAAALTALGCGGSSSETPFPLEPLPPHLRAKPAESAAAPSSTVEDAASPSASTSDAVPPSAVAPANVAPTSDKSLDSSPTWGR